MRILHLTYNRLVGMVCLACCLSGLLISGCGLELSGSYKPPFIPIRFVINTNGQISMEADASVATPIGEFGVGAAAENNLQPPDNGMLMFIQRLVNGQPQDGAFQVNEDDSEKTIVIDDDITFRVTGKLISVNARGHHKILLTSPNAENGNQTVQSQPTQGSGSQPRPTSVPVRPPTNTPIPVILPTATPPPIATATPTPCWKNGGSGVTFYSGANFTGQSVTIWHRAEERGTITNLPAGIAGNLGSFSDANNAWHVVLYQLANGTGNLGHYDASWSNVDQYWHATQSVKVYLNGC